MIALAREWVELWLRHSTPDQSMKSNRSTLSTQTTTTTTQGHNFSFLFFSFSFNPKTQTKREEGIEDIDDLGILLDPFELHSLIPQTLLIHARKTPTKKKKKKRGVNEEREGLACVIKRERE